MDRTLTLVTAFFGAMLLFTETHARSCKSVDIFVHNRSDALILVRDIDFHDPDANRWRSEAISNRKIGTGRVRGWSRNLQRIDGELTRIRIDYSVEAETCNHWPGIPSSWHCWESDVLSVTSDQFRCSRGVNVDIDIR